MTYYSRNNFYIGQCVAMFHGNLSPIRDSHLSSARQNSENFLNSYLVIQKIINRIPWHLFHMNGLLNIKFCGFRRFFRIFHRDMNNQHHSARVILKFHKEHKKQTTELIICVVVDQVENNAKGLFICRCYGVNRWTMYRIDISSSYATVGKYWSTRSERPTPFLSFYPPLSKTELSKNRIKRATNANICCDTSDFLKKF